MSIYISEDSGWSQVVFCLVVETAKQTREQGLSDLKVVEIVREAVRNFEKEHSGTSVYFGERTSQVFTLYLGSILTQQGIINADTLAKAAVSVAFNQATGDCVYIPSRAGDFISLRNTAIRAEYHETPSYENIKRLAKKYNVTSRQIYKITGSVREELKRETIRTTPAASGLTRSNIFDPPVRCAEIIEGKQ